VVKSAEDVAVFTALELIIKSTAVEGFIRIIQHSWLVPDPVGPFATIHWYWGLKLLKYTQHSTNKFEVAKSKVAGVELISI
jgi:hypothetical protein